MVAWLEWTADAFARAEAERKPVLLAVSAAWCHWCREMDRVSYGDPSVAALIAERFVPVRVDADRRPDINERYNLGGWPTTAFLTPGGEILGGTTFVEPAALKALLARIADAFAARGPELEARARAARSAQPMPAAQGAADPADLAWFEATLRTQFDAEEGGFGLDPKLPHAPALQLAIDLFTEGRDSEWLAIFTRSLDAMGWGGLYDRVDGGFFRYSTARDWSQPQTEKLLEDNAALLRVYLAAWQATGHRSYRDKAIDVIRYIHTTGADLERGGFAASQAADPAFYALATADARRERTPPFIDATIYADANGAIAAAYLRAAVQLEDATLAEFAVQSIERVVLAAYRPGDGLAHVVEAPRGPAGFLSDQIRMADALVEAHEASGRTPFLEMAEELMRYCLRRLWDDTGGGFYDRCRAGEPEIGLLNEPLKPFALNCLAAQTLSRLSRVAGRPDLEIAARRTLDAVAPAFRDLGLHAAPYALAVRAVIGRPGP